MQASEIIQKATSRSDISAPEKKVSIEAWEKWAQFKTIKDQQLEAMLKAVRQFVLSFKAWEPISFLVLLGAPGVGKTHLARRIMKWFDDGGSWFVGPRDENQFLRGHFVRWSDYMQECREGDSSRMDDMLTDNLLVIDDLAVTADTRAWMVEKLYRLLDHRIIPFGLNQGEKRRPRGTVITCNLTLEQIAEQFDARIASRLVRLGKENVIEVETMDYAMRQ